MIKKCTCTILEMCDSCKKVSTKNTEEYRNEKLLEAFSSLKEQGQKLKIVPDLRKI